jgi:hypothetical protein
MVEPEVKIPANLLQQYVELHADNEATEFVIDLNIDDSMMRLGFYNENGELAKYTMTAPEAYEFAHIILRGYDRLEGL